MTFPCGLDRQSRWLIFATTASIAIIVSWVYFTRVELPSFSARFELHQEIIAGTAGSPYRYRVFIPYLAEAFSQAAKGFGVSDKYAFLLSYSLINVVFINLFLVLAYGLFRFFYSQKSSLIGVLFIGCMIHIGLQDHEFQPWSVPEAAFFVAALILLKSNREKFLLPLVLVSSLNRETGVLIVILAFLILLPDAREAEKLRKLRPALIALFAWCVVFAGLRLWLGGAAHVTSVLELWERNLQMTSLLRTLFNVVLVLGGWWAVLFYVVTHYQLDRFISRSWLILPFYLPLVIIFGVWFEVRLLFPLYPLMVATCLVAFERGLQK